MSRACWKGYFLKKKLLGKIYQKIWSRSSTIPFYFIGHKVMIHNGKEFKLVYITRQKVGYKFGDFSFTRKHTKKIKILKKIKNGSKS